MSSESNLAAGQIAMRVMDREVFNWLDWMIPLFPDVANAMKKKYGMQYLIERQFYLSRAVEEFGEDWLKE